MRSLAACSCRCPALGAAPAAMPAGPASLPCWLPLLHARDRVRFSHKSGVHTLRGQSVTRAAKLCSRSSSYWMARRAAAGAMRYVPDTIRPHARHECPCADREGQPREATSSRGGCKAVRARGGSSPRSAAWRECERRCPPLPCEHSSAAPCPLASQSHPTRAPDLAAHRIPTQHQGSCR